MDEKRILVTLGGRVERSQGDGKKSSWRCKFDWVDPNVWIQLALVMLVIGLGTSTIVLATNQESCPPPAPPPPAPINITYPMQTTSTTSGIQNCRDFHDLMVLHKWPVNPKGTPSGWLLTCIIHSNEAVYSDYATYNGYKSIASNSVYTNLQTLQMVNPLKNVKVVFPSFDADSTFWQNCILYAKLSTDAVADKALGACRALQVSDERRGFTACNWNCEYTTLELVLCQYSCDFDG